MSEKKTHKHKGYYIKEGKKVSTKHKHSETYSNEVYKHVKEGKHLTDSQGRQRKPAGKGDANRISDYEEFRDNFDEIKW
jgi:hypothetical protein